MTLLVAQLQAQDPLSPMDASEFMSQLAQLQTVVELQNMKHLLLQGETGRMLGEAVSFIGRDVEWLDAESGERRSGTVESVDLSDGSCSLVVGQQRLMVNDVLAVS
jgi:flagellar basal-body rod modification protein FlgD